MSCSNNGEDAVTCRLCQEKECQSLISRKARNKTEYRFAFWPALHGSVNAHHGPIVSSQEAAEGGLSIVADYTLMLHECSLMEDHSNMGWIEKRVTGGDWEEIDEDDL